MRYLLASLVLFLSAAAQAQGVATFNYQRGTISIERLSPPALPPLPWKDGATQPEHENARIAISVDIRPISALYQREGWISLGALSQAMGVLFVLDRPDTVRVGRMEYSQPLDAIWLDETGIVTSIAPNLAVSTLNEPMIDQKPSKALLLLPAGMAAASSIRPGDKVKDSEYFQAPPDVLTLPR